LLAEEWHLAAHAQQRWAGPAKKALNFFEKGQWG
jgi:hypothetical protein